MTPPIAHPSVNWLAISPEIALAVAGVVIVMLRSVLRRRPVVVPLCTVVAISGVVAAGAVQYRLWHLLRGHRAMTTIAGMVRVGPVYTPPDLRGRGYASAVTAEVSRAALAAGAGEVLLYTDLANPVSNSIYQRIGYGKIEDRVVLSFSGR